MVSARESIGSAGPAGASALAEADVLQALVRQAQDGDLSALATLIGRYQVRLAGLVRPIVRDPELVKDVVQTVAVKLVRRLPGLRSPASFESWLFKMARNTALDEIRRARCRPLTVPDETLLDQIIDPGPEDRSDEVMEVVGRVVGEWPSQNRRILECIMAGRSYQTVASREGLSLGAVKLRVHRLRRILRERVGPLLAERCEPHSTFAPSST